MPILPQFLAQPLVRSAQRFVSFFGFELQDNRTQAPIRDAYLYKPMLSPWLSSDWKQRLHSDDPRSLVPLAAKYILYSTALDAIRRCDGSLAECGVYKGGTAKILAELAPERPLYLFDTFVGMPDTDPARDLHKAGDFSDTTLASVQQYLAVHANVRCAPGLVPQSLEIVRDEFFSFVHIDLDIYTAIKGACEFFYPRLQPGGVMLFDDYGYPSCPGARDAVEEFFNGKTEVLQAMATGQCVVRKL